MPALDAGKADRKRGTLLRERVVGEQQPSATSAELERASVPFTLGSRPPRLGNTAEPAHQQVAAKDHRAGERADGRPLRGPVGSRYAGVAAPTSRSKKNGLTARIAASS